MEQEVSGTEAGKDHQLLWVGDGILCRYDLVYGAGVEG